MSSEKCGALKQPKWNVKVFLVSWPRCFVMAGVVVIRVFIVLGGVKGDGTCFIPAFGSLFSPGERGRERRASSRHRDGNIACRGDPWVCGNE